MKKILDFEDIVLDFGISIRACALECMHCCYLWYGISMGLDFPGYASNRNRREICCFFTNLQNIGTDPLRVGNEVNPLQNNSNSYRSIGTDPFGLDNDPAEFWNDSVLHDFACNYGK